MTRRIVLLAAICGCSFLGDKASRAAEMASAPIQSASFPLFHHHHRRAQPAPQVAYYAPQPMQYAPAAACQSCTTTCTQRVCQYVPQTAYRIAYTNVPVTTLRPVTTTDPCTGCTTTCMRPFTVCHQQAHYVPYTTYSLACQNVTTTQPTACPTAAPMAVSYAPQPTACAGCTPTSAAMPASPYLPPSSAVPATPSPAVMTPGPTGTNGGLPAPVLNGQATSGASWPRTATTWQPPVTPPQNESRSATVNETPPMRPLAAPPATPHRDRTAGYGPPRAWQYSAVQWPAPAGVNPPVHQGWAAVPR